MARRSSLLVQVVNASIKASKQAERERIRAHNAQIRYQAQVSREAKRAWVEVMLEDAEAQTEDLQEQLKEIDDILRHTLSVDDFYDLEKIRQHVTHPQMVSEDASPIDEPEYELHPESPKPVAKLFKLVAKAKADLLEIEKTQAWRQACDAVDENNLRLEKSWKNAEELRKARFAEDKKRYKEECLAREIEVQKANAELDAVIRGIPKGDKNSIETYAELVFSESDYPYGVEPTVEVDFDPIARELSLEIEVVPPGVIPQASGFRFQRNIGEIVEKKQTQKEIKERYERYVCSVALRSIHEILEADRGGVIRFVSARGFVNHISSATGNATSTNLIEVAVARESFQAIVLEKVEPAAALVSLGASLSKNFYGLTPIPAGKSVRKN